MSPRALLRAAALLLPLTASAQATAPGAPAPGAPAPAAPAPATPALPWLANLPAADAPTPGLEGVEFDEAVRRAALHATSATIAAEEIARAEGLLEQVRSGALPALSANGTYTRTSYSQVGGRQLPSQDVTYGNLSLAVPLLVPSRWYQWSHASDVVAVTRAGQQDVRRSVALVAARAYLAIIAQKRAIDASRRAVATSRAHFEFATRRRAGGVGNALDEARADQQLATAETQLEAFLAGLVRAQEALGVATGGTAPLDARGDPDLRATAASVDDFVREGETNRADLRAARERADAAHRVARDSWADWLPTVSAVGQTFVQDPATLSSPPNGWLAQLVVSFPLFEGGLRTGQRHERDAIDAENRAALDGLVLQARSDVRAAVDSVQHAEAALAQARRAADRAQAALRLVAEAYRAGATTSLDVVDAERAARDADTAAVVAEDAARQSRLDLLAATGRFP